MAIAGVNLTFGCMCSVITRLLLYLINSKLWRGLLKQILNRFSLQFLPLSNAFLSRLPTEISIGSTESDSIKIKSEWIWKLGHFTAGKLSGTKTCKFCSVTAEAEVFDKITCNHNQLTSVFFVLSIFWRSKVSGWNGSQVWDRNVLLSWKVKYIRRPTYTSECNWLRYIAGVFM